MDQRPVNLGGFEKGRTRLNGPGGKGLLMHSNLCIDRLWKFFFTYYSFQTKKHLMLKMTKAWHMGSRWVDQTHKMTRMSLAGGGIRSHTRVRTSETFRGVWFPRWDSDFTSGRTTMQRGSKMNLGLMAKERWKGRWQNQGSHSRQLL